MNPQCAFSLTYQANLISFPLKYYIAQGLETSFPVYNLSQAGLTLSYFATFLFQSHSSLPRDTNLESGTQKHR